MDPELEGQAGAQIVRRAAEGVNPRRNPGGLPRHRMCVSDVVSGSALRDACAQP